MYPEFSRAMAISCLLDGIKHNEDEIVSDYIDMELYRTDILEDDIGIRFGQDNLVVLDETTVTAIDIRGLPKKEGELQKQVLKHQVLHLLFPDNFPNFLEGVDLDESLIDFPYVIRERVYGVTLTSHGDVSYVMSGTFQPIKKVFEDMECPLGFDHFNPGNFMRTRSGAVKYVDVINQVSSDWNCNKLANYLSEYKVSPEVYTLLKELEQIQLDTQVNKEPVLAWE